MSANLVIDDLFHQQSNEGVGQGVMRMDPKTP